MKHLLLLSMVLAAAFLGGCDDKSKNSVVRVTVDYELDRKFNWDSNAKKLKGAIRIKTISTAKEMPQQSTAYGIAFELTPGDRTTILVMTDGEGTYFTGDYPDLPIQLPRLLSIQTPDTIRELVDPETCAVCEVAISTDSLDGNYCFLFTCFNLKSGWLYHSTIDLPVKQTFSNSDYVPLAKGKEGFKRLR